MFNNLFNKKPSNDLTVNDVHEQRRTNTDLVVIDVREPEEFVGGHVAGATLVPLSQIALKLNDIPRDKPVAVMCRSGNRSGLALNFLQQQGYTNARNVAGGMLAWEKAGLPVERGQ